MLNYIKEKEWHGTEKFKMIFILCIAFILPLIIANVPYMDDNTRLDNGYGYWEIEGRPLTTLLMKILNFNATNIYNIAPLPLIIGVLFFSFSVYYVTSKMDMKKNLINIIPFIFLICNPFFLQNMSYQYDNIGHIFSVSLLLLSFFYENKNKIKEVSIASLLLLLSCSSYQPSTNIFIVLFFLNIIYDIKKYNNLSSYIIKKSLIYIIGLFGYYIFYYIGFTFFFHETANRNNLINISQILESYRYSFKEFLELTNGFNKDTIRILIDISFIMFIFNILYKIVKEMKTEKSIIKIVLLLFTPFFILLSIWGPFILLKELFFNPRDFPVIGVFFMGAAYSFKFIDKKGYLQVLIISAILLCVFSFSYIYGNALNQDYMYKKYVYDNISLKLEEKEDVIAKKQIRIYGRNAMSSFVGQALIVHPFLSKLIFPDNTNFFKAYNLAARNVYNIKGGVVLDDYEEWINICKNKPTPLIKDGNYEVYNFKDHVSIWFKRTPDFCDNTPLESESHFDKKEQYLNNLKENK